MINQTPSKTYTFLHSFKDGTVGEIKLCELKQNETCDLNKMNIQLPLGKGKRFCNEFQRWMEEIIYPFMQWSPREFALLYKRLSE